MQKSPLSALVASSMLLTLGLSRLSAVQATELTTEYLAVNGLNFTCSVLKKKKEDETTHQHKDVMLLHGFPYSREWWSPLLNLWANTTSISVHAVACNMRGYSAGASPDNIEDYSFDKLEADVLALTKAAGFEQKDGFHLLGHDHGAGLGYYIAANNPTKVQSFTSLSAPHPKLMSEALCGDNTDEAQVLAFTYTNQYSLPDSASRNNASLTRFYRTFGLIDDSLQPEQFQKMLWWYNRSHEHWSVPRVVSDEEVVEYGSPFFLTSQRQAIPLEERPCMPVEESAQVGTVEAPVLFICGAQDPYVLCNNDYAVNVPANLMPNFEHASFRCEHNFFDEGNCDDREESQAVMDTITAFVLGNEEAIFHDEDETNVASGGATTVAVPLFAAFLSGLMSLIAM
ncbi:Epoxide hydrolase [Seminavis robusta]|uniref:Epoxide hydrolase n=1 Tax=Seminavis robusta TaxID=568900 RepID=A0A9N8H7J4_9STRA|nr:Epoxide hydrolase [Seminavis robusta]|eukprot:Sro181_g079180.1 Epoxide hydrolase (399) ;mRNA; f:80769-81965